MFLTVIHVTLWQCRFAEKNVFRNESPNRNILVTELFEALCSAWQSRILRRIDEQLEFDHTCTFNDSSSTLLYQRDRRGECSTGSNQIINHQHAVSLLDLIFLNRKPRAIAVFCFVFLAFNGVRHFPLLSHHDERLFQSQGDGRTKDKTSCIEAGNRIDSDCFVTIHKDVYDLLKDFGFVKESTNVVKTIDSLERKVRQVLRNLFGFFAILLVLKIESRHGFVLRTRLGTFSG
mmetsp:Transcript_24963/g.53181  ORF Transcript_24963/g.53181 Transcript_24963/m.53181 type:complete len:233 (+) Transcript_24963:584-1282(+)